MIITKTDSSSRQQCHKHRGFTLPELLVAGALSAAFFTAAALVYQSITYNQKHHQTIVPVTIDPTPTGLSDALENFYPTLAGQTVLNVYSAPSYGRAAAAGNVYDRFWEDVEKASAVFCHVRHGQLNTIRPMSLEFPANTLGTDIDSHSEFLESVLKNDPTHGTAAATVYTSFRNAAPLPTGTTPIHAGGTVYVIQPDNSNNQLGVRATYEIDLLQSNSPIGVYASVRRYVTTGLGAQLSDYYDIFYPEASVLDFGPLFVAFEKEGRLTLSETTNDAYGVPINNYKVAKQHPFFLMWWPDPALMLGKDGTELDGTTLPTTTDRRTSYFRMTARTGLMFAVPVFPAL